MPQPANQNRHLVTPIPGPRSQALRAREDEHLAPGVRSLTVIPGTGHFPWLDDPERYWAVITDFIRTR